jgi:predicted nucleic-acid-binding protein
VGPAICESKKSVILETEWVLRHAYGIDSATILDGLTTLFGLKNVTVEDSWTVRQCLTWYGQGFDFADALHLASGAKASRFATFDKKLIKKSLKVTSIRAFEP